MSSVKLLTTVKQRTDITQRAAEQRSVHCSETAAEDCGIC